MKSFSSTIRLTLIFLLVVLLASCSGSSTATGTSNEISQEDISTPTPTPEPTKVSLITEEEAASFIVGEKGGSAQAGGHSIVIPEGILQEDVELSMENLTEENLPASIPLFTEFLGAVSFGPDGLEFEEPIRITIPLAQNRDPGKVLSLYIFDTQEEVFMDSGIAAVVTESGNTAEAWVSHFSVYVALDGLTGQTLGGHFLETVVEGEAPEKAYDNILGYLREQDLEIGACLAGDRYVAGYMLDVTYQLGEEHFGNNVLIGEETPDIHLNRMELNIKRTVQNDLVKEVYFDMILVIYLGSECPLVYEGFPSYADATTICTCSGCFNEFFTARIFIDEAGNVTGDVYGIEVSGTRDSITGSRKSGPNNCDSYCTTYVETRITNDDQILEGVMWDKCTPGDCEFQNCVGTWTFSLHRR